MYKTRFVLLIVLTTLAALASPAKAWDQHFTFTQVAAEELADRIPVLEVTIGQSSLEEFLQTNEAGVKQLFKDFYAWKYKVYKYPHWQLSSENYSYLYTDGKGQMDRPRFLELLGVQSTGLGKITVSDEFTQIHNIATINANTRLPFATWLALFSDEPDWGADIGLFGKDDPRYSGKIPYGDIDKLSSQAPFHMYFPNERLITYTASKSLKESMALLRFNVFVRLARLAWNGKDLFWTARFLGNAMHYLQDVANPYHSSALPYANIITYVKYFAVKDKAKFLADNMQILANRHFAYEALALEFMLLTQDNLKQFIKVTEVLKRGYDLGVADTDKDYCVFLSEIFNRVSKAAYKTARPVDKLITKNFPAHLVKDPKFDPQTRDDFQLSVWFNQDLLSSILKDPKAKQGDLVKAFLIDAVRTFECTALLMGYILR